MGPSFKRELRSCQLCGKGGYISLKVQHMPIRNPCVVLAGSCGFLCVIPDTWAALESAHAHTSCTQTSHCVCKTKNQTALSAGQKYATTGQGPTEETQEQDNEKNLPKKQEVEENGTKNPPRKEIKQEEAVDKATQDVELNFCASL